MVDAKGCTSIWGSWWSRKSQGRGSLGKHCQENTKGLLILVKSSNTPNGKAFASVKRCCKNSTLFCSKLIALSKPFKRNLNYQFSITYVALYEEEPEAHWTFN